VIQSLYLGLLFGKRAGDRQEWLKSPRDQHAAAVLQIAGMPVIAVSVPVTCGRHRTAAA